MKVYFLYRFNGQDSTRVSGYIRELKQRYSMADTNELDLNTRDGAATASLYDAMAYPAILVTRNDGQLAQIWQGEPLPLVDEVISYAMM
ncbi:hypothetical protein IPO96_00785 [Candidatus Saccharibacteria bacterium]|jgi:hypothetical protein|nr:MAG: hypothetical protein IPO96_00785 [Candidatus Saccharibacteria bacterium]